MVVWDLQWFTSIEGPKVLPCHHVAGSSKRPSQVELLARLLTHWSLVECSQTREAERAIGSLPPLQTFSFNYTEPSAEFTLCWPLQPHHHHPRKKKKSSLSFAAEAQS